MAAITALLHLLPDSGQSNVLPPVALQSGMEVVPVSTVPTLIMFGGFFFKL
jgi:hypothetical protein